MFKSATVVAIQWGGQAIMKLPEKVSHGKYVLTWRKVNMQEKTKGHVDVRTSVNVEEGSTHAVDIDSTGC